MEPWRTRWVIEAEVGGAKHKYLFDTGAGLTLASAATLKSTGCEPWGRVTGFRMFGDRLDGPRCEDVPMKLGGLTLKAPAVTTVDMAKLNPKDAGLDGVIGLNLFEGRTITIDFAAGTVTVETKASEAQRVRHMRPLPVRLKREADGLALAVMAEVPTAKGRLMFELDSGNGGTVLVSKPVAQLVGLDPSRDGKQKADFPVARNIRATTEDAFVPDMIMDGNLGMPFLRNWVVTLDLKNGKAWLGRPPVPPAAAPPLPPKS